MFDKISKYVTDMIYSTLDGVDPERREIIEYGVYMTASEIVKMPPPWPYMEYSGHCWEGYTQNRTLDA